ncbi:MAG: HAD-IC family P-type ATPase [bacterium]
MADPKTKIIPYHNQSPQDVLDAFSSSKNGLSKVEAKDRLKEYGHNALPEQPPRTIWKIIFSQFTSPLMAILIVAGLASVVLGEFFDAGIILVAALVNTALGFFEEYKADRSLEKLKKFLPQTVKARRGGVIETINSHDVVPGDVVFLSAGDKLTADGRIISSQSFEVNEAALTGESGAVKKNIDAVNADAIVSDQTSMVFAGTVVVSGKAEAVIVGTGINTELGRISELVRGVEDEKTPLQHQLAVFSRVLGIAILVLATIVFVAGVLRGLEAVEMFKVAVAIAVSAVPEGLVVAVTVVLAIGMQRILKQKALVRRLVAAETLGSVSVICTDKTGTLTTGQMEVVEVRIDSEPEKIGKELTVGQKELLMALSNTSSVVTSNNADEKTLVGSPTEVAIMKFVLAHTFVPEFLESDELADMPFDSRIKFSARLFKDGNKARLFVVGAPEALLSKTDVTDSERKKLLDAFNNMTNRGLRVLMAAEAVSLDKTDEIDESDVVDLKPLGFVGLRDPLRKEAARTIAQARDAGLIPVMITGDHPETARLIARQAGLPAGPENVITGVELDELNDEELYERIESISVFARVVPRHKLRIVRAWQHRGHPVAMVGDGVNDAPAMKAADIGVAVGSGTEVAKETADMILLDNNFSTIVRAIKEGRIIFENIRKMIVYLLSDSFSEVVLVLGALIIGLPLPILPAQILWINLITDGFPNLALTFEPGEKGIMKEPPRKKDEKILNGEMKVLIFLIGILTDVALFGIYFYLLDRGFNIDEIRTFIFAALGIDSLIYVFAVRQLRTSVFRSNPFANKFLVGGVALGFLLLLAPLTIAPLMSLFNFTSLTFVEWMALVGIALAELLLIEIVKEIYNVSRRRRIAMQ